MSIQAPFLELVRVLGTHEAYNPAPVVLDKVVLEKRTPPAVSIDAEADPYYAQLEKLVAPDESSALDWIRSISGDQYDNVVRALVGPLSDTEIASSILDSLGYSNIELVPSILEKRERVKLEHSSEEEAVGVPAEVEEPSALEMLLRGPASAAPTPPTNSRDMYTPQSQIRVIDKKARQTHRPNRTADADDAAGVSVEEWSKIRLATLERNANMALISGNKPTLSRDTESYPNVYTSARRGAGGGSVAMPGTKTMLPEGTVRVEKEAYSEITLPAPKPIPLHFNESLVTIKSMDVWGQRTFQAYSTLNRLQSIVYPVAYKSNENMLVCAPTGAGKTDVALLTILHTLGGLSESRKAAKMTPNSPVKLPPPSDYKIVYVAPLKALAAEVTQKFAKRLAWAGVKVKEYTGDMRLTRQEVDATGVIVTTPEKWDVVTRKNTSGDGEIADKVKLLIIDEVHLLHEDRGAVIESIVARTLRQVEAKQNMIRIVGLSATLPNYVDVADFLRVNRYTGLFYFDAAFRPVPLEQHFIGVKNVLVEEKKPGNEGDVTSVEGAKAAANGKDKPKKKGASKTPRINPSKANLDTATFDKVSELVRNGHQVMVFVHSRKDTVKTAQMLHLKFQDAGMADLMDKEAAAMLSTPALSRIRKDLSMSKNKELQELAPQGFGIHHAGMLRSDRNITEKLFENNATKVLCCTATLAWGVNLPAYAVVIKGTQIYDSSKGAFVDLSILDVLQIFGRAGRPQYETHGVGYICTTQDKLDHYISAITQQHPIESKFIKGLVDALNAEISLGTVTTIDEGVRWLGYSYLFVRMRKNPLIYGIPWDEVLQDPLLGSMRHTLITNAAKTLKAAQMINFDADMGSLSSTELGTIAAKYYIKHTTIEIFNRMLKPVMTEADVLTMISSSVEFEQVAVRDSETQELRRLIDNVIPCQVRGGTNSSSGKVNVLIQSYISRSYVDDFALVSDMAYVADNGARIARAVADIAISKRWANASRVLLSICKSIERRLWSFNHPLAQFDMPVDIVYNTEQYADDLTIDQIAAMSGADFGALIKLNEKLGTIAVTKANQLPRMGVYYTAKPITYDMLKVTVDLKSRFIWNERVHGSLQVFWVSIEMAQEGGRGEDEAAPTILEIRRLALRPDSPRTIVEEFIVHIPSLVANSFLAIRCISDTWITDDDYIVDEDETGNHIIDLKQIEMPLLTPSLFKLQSLPLLSLKDILKDSKVAAMNYTPSTQNLDVVQTHACHSVYKTHANVYVSAVSRASKDVLLELALLRAFEHKQDSKILILAPRNSLALQLNQKLKDAFSGQLFQRACVTHRSQVRTIWRTDGPSVVICTPHSLLKEMMLPEHSFGADFDAIAATDLHCMDSTYEMVLAMLLQVKREETRLLGFSWPLVNYEDITHWLEVDGLTHIYPFSPQIRSASLVTRFETFAMPHSYALLRTMARHVYEHLKDFSFEGDAKRQLICVVPSRAQCRITGRDLLALIAGDVSKLEGMDQSGLAPQIESSLLEMNYDDELVAFARNGISIYHDGLTDDEKTVEIGLFSQKLTQILIVSKETCWSLPSEQVNASTVVVMSGQSVKMLRNSDSERENTNVKQLIDYTLPELTQMQGFVSATGGELVVMCQPRQEVVYSRFLTDGLALESELAVSETDMDTYVLNQLVAGRLGTANEIVEVFLNDTYFAQRVRSNVSYYDNREASEGAIAENPTPETKEEKRQRIIERTALQIISRLEARGCCNLPGGSELTRMFAKITMTGFAALFVERHMGASEIDRLLKTPFSAFRDKLQKGLISKETPDSLLLPAVQSFYQRLPRTIKNELTDEEGVLKRSKEPIPDESILLPTYKCVYVAFTHGRVVRDSELLYAVQEKCIKFVLDHVTLK